jgi:thioredoxin-dependent peroxiredoxin
LLHSRAVIEEGAPAPDFELLDENGNAVRLSDFRGRRVVLFFYPKDDTPGCTKEACSFRDSFDVYRERDAVILGVSRDDATSHTKFKAKYSLPFTLLSDPDATVARMYGVWRQRSFAGKKFMGIYRSTFVIDADGNVAKAMYGVKPAGHAEAVLGVL